MRVPQTFRSGARFGGEKTARGLIEIQMEISLGRDPAPFPVCGLIRAMVAGISPEPHDAVGIARLCRGSSLLTACRLDPSAAKVNRYRHEPFCVHHHLPR